RRGRAAGAGQRRRADRVRQARPHLRPAPRRARRSGAHLADLRIAGARRGPGRDLPALARRRGGGGVMAFLAMLLCASGPALELGLRSEVRGRTPQPLDAPGTMARDLQLDPRASLALGEGPLLASIAYAPRLLLSDLGTEASRAAPLHRIE